MERYATGRRNLDDAVAMWPTPTSRDWRSGKNLSCWHNARPLNEMVQVFPTPTANRWDGLQSHGVNVVTGSLNPHWVSWLMGFPMDWCDLPDERQQESQTE